MHIAFVIVYEHINFPIKASIIIFRIDFCSFSVAGRLFASDDCYVRLKHQLHSLYLWGYADFFHLLFFFFHVKREKKEDRGKQKQIAPNYQRYQEMWMNNDAHENNAKKNAEEVKKNTSAWLRGSNIATKTPLRKKKTLPWKKWWKAENKMSTRYEFVRKMLWILIIMLDIISVRCYIVHGVRWLLLRWQPVANTDKATHQDTHREPS